MNAPVITAGAKVIASPQEAVAVAHEIAEWLAHDAVDRDRDRTLPLREMERLSQSGVLAISVPARFGGADVPLSTVVEVIRILSTGDGAIGQLPQNHFLFVDAILEDGSEEQQMFFTRELMRGARFGNAQAERGSSSLDLRTRLVAADDARFFLNGTKYYCTGAIVADWIPVAALDEEERQVIAFVRRHADGVEVLPDWNAFGQKTTFSGTAVFTQVSVRPGDVIPHWRLFDRANIFHPYGALLHAAVDVGIARSAIDETVRLVRSRSRPRLGAGAATSQGDPLLLAKLGRREIEVRALEAYLSEAGALLDAARRTNNEVAIAEAATAALGAKALAEEIGLAAASDLFALVGTASTDAALGLDRYWRNLRVHSVHDANDWRFAQVGDWEINRVAPRKPLRKAAS